MRLLKTGETVVDLLISKEVSLTDAYEAVDDIAVDWHGGKYPGRTLMSLKGLTPDEITWMHQNGGNTEGAFKMAMKRVRSGNSAPPTPLASSRQTEARV